MTLQLQWSLDNTVERSVRIGTSLLMAAASDDVQLIAVLACEKFGNTIPISHDTRRIIEHKVIPTPPSRWIRFVEGYVGFKTRDTATELAKSQAGIRFLGLAAALVSTIGRRGSAEVIERMIDRTASQKDMVPSIRHIEDVMVSLEDRCLLSGFADRVAKWSERCRTAGGFGKTTPSEVCIDDLIDAFRHLERIGEDDTVTEVKVTASTSAPWIAALAEWCLEVPPLVRTHDGHLLTTPSQSKVEIVVNPMVRDVRETIEIDLVGRLGNITHLAKPEYADRFLWKAMLSSEAYWNFRLADYELDSGIAFRAIKVAIPVALAEVLNNLEIIGAVPDRDDDRFQPARGSKAASMRLLPFNHQSVHQALKLLMKFKVAPQLDPLGKGLRITDLEIIQAVVRDWKTTCNCDACLTNFEEVNAGVDSYVVCREIIFWRNLSSLVADVLSVSLFEHPDEMQFTTTRRRTTRKFQNSIQDLLQSGVKDDFDAASRRDVCHISDVFLHALYLVGHDLVALSDEPKEDVYQHADRWLMSSSYGQTVYPTILETLELTRSGFLSLTWLRGTLHYRDEIYSLVEETRVAVATFGKDPNSHLYQTPVAKPLSLPGNLKLAWKVRREDRGLLTSGLGLECPSNEYQNILQRPVMNFWSNISYALFVEDCPHDKDVPLMHDRFAQFVSPVYPSAPEDFPTYPQIPIRVVPVDSANDARFFVLGQRDNFIDTTDVIRGQACLACCLDVCGGVPSPRLIL